MKREGRRRVAAVRGKAARDMDAAAAAVAAEFETDVVVVAAVEDVGVVAVGDDDCAARSARRPSLAHRGWAPDWGSLSSDPFCRNWVTRGRRRRQRCRWWRRGMPPLLGRH